MTTATLAIASNSAIASNASACNAASSSAASSSAASANSVASNARACNARACNATPAASAAGTKAGGEGSRLPQLGPTPWHVAAVAASAASHGTALAGLLLAAHGAWVDAGLLHHLAALGLGAAALLLQRFAGVAAKQCLLGRGWIDAATGFHNLRGLLGEGDLLLREAQRADRPVGVVLLDFPDLREAREVLGTAAADRIAARLVRRIRRIAGAAGLAARTGAGQFVVLLPGQGQQGSVAALQRGLGRATSLECEAEVVLVPDVLVDVATRLEGSIGLVMREMVQELYGQRDREERRAQRARERQSRPAALE